ncbi:unnamed protein product [Brugia pahangi]|uniref:Galectin n=1 Tax=Brugia pahangi TaxID=6280 RepID=A0A0N4TBN8_BRUPA|nr:unnamed protein product [Brugia pahangi]
MMSMQKWIVWAPKSSIPAVLVLKLVGKVEDVKIDPQEAYVLHFNVKPRYYRDFSSFLLFIMKRGEYSLFRIIVVSFPHFFQE